MGNVVEELNNFIEDATSRYPAIGEIVLFGSRARGDATPESDWDIAVVFDQHNDQTATSFLNDPALRCFTTPLDLFALRPDGEWLYPNWPEPRAGGFRTTLRGEKVFAPMQRRFGSDDLSFL
jgi:predicted nucleotidyltransferase